MIDITGLATYIIYREQNSGMLTKHLRRKFFKDLAKQLCMPEIEARSKNRMLMGKYFERGAVEMVLGRRIQVDNGTDTQTHHE